MYDTVIVRAWKHNGVKAICTYIYSFKSSSKTPNEFLRNIFLCFLVSTFRFFFFLHCPVWALAIYTTTPFCCLYLASICFFSPILLIHLPFHIPQITHIYQSLPLFQASFYLIVKMSRHRKKYFTQIIQSSDKHLEKRIFTHSDW